MFAGGTVVDECRGPTGTLLWQTLRDVVLWSSTPLESLPRLFAEGSLERRLAHLRSSVQQADLQALLAAVSRGVLGGGGQREDVAAACLQVAEWAERQERTATALSFAQAASLANPLDAEPAVKVGFIAARRKENARAESWFRRAAVLGRRMGSATAQARAHLGLGSLLADRGDVEAARRFLKLCYRRARRGGFNTLKSAALHGLFDLAVQGPPPRNPEPLDDPESLARWTIRQYGAAHADAPRLIRTWVRFRLAQTPPVPVLLSDSSPVLRGPKADRAYLLAVIAREAAAVGAYAEYEHAWACATELIERSSAPRDQPKHVAAFLELAVAASLVKDIERAEHLGQRALGLACEAGLAGTRGEVEAFLTELRHGRDDQPDADRSGEPRDGE